MLVVALGEPGTPVMTCAVERDANAKIKTIAAVSVATVFRIPLLLRLRNRSHGLANDLGEADSSGTHVGQN